MAKRQKKTETEIVRVRAADGEELDIEVEQDFFLDQDVWIPGYKVARFRGAALPLSIEGDEFVDPRTRRRFARVRSVRSIS